jgi:hypothetical protein
MRQAELGGIAAIANFRACAEVKPAQTGGERSDPTCEACQ